MANTDTGGEWSFGAGTDFVLKQGAVGSASNAKTKLFKTRIDDATLTGSLTTGGTTCGGGCDAVFAPDYPLPSIADHAARMRALGYLPNVGPTPEGAPFNVTDKLGRMLNELEHARSSSPSNRTSLPRSARNSPPSATNWPRCATASGRWQSPGTELQDTDDQDKDLP
ncbi:MAG: hypothetical protein R3D85_15045 [Paracoccaceae bacterium]